MSAASALFAGTAVFCVGQPVPASAQTATPLPPVTVEKQKVKAKVKPKPPARSQQAVSSPAAGEEAALAGKKGLSKPLTSTTVSGEAIASKAPATSDTASLLRDVPGVSTYTGGGVSNLPAIHGFADERISTTLNGMILSAACANHMNPPLSYIDPSQVKKIDVYAGVTPVSVGGDSIGGTIAVESLTPQFAGPDEGVVTHGSLSGFVRSNGNGIGGNASASAATSNFAASYTGTWSRADDYKDGNGDVVKSTLYEAQNHLLTLAARGSSDLLVVNGGIQSIPYQGFVNQWMDMTDNEAWFVNGQYEKKLDWGKLYVQAYYQHIDHEMEFLSDKKLGRLAAGRMPNMPMLTEGENMGYKVKAEIPVFSSSMLRVGNELHRNTLDDWWPAVGTKPGTMCCDTFWNINGGERTRFGTFAEIETKWSKQWTTLIGVRNDIVLMDTGDVQGYNNDPNWCNNADPQKATMCQFYDKTKYPKEMMSLDYLKDANAFNAAKHAKTDINFDATALVRYEPTSDSTYEFGYARKTRSPSLYERYTWSTNGMAMSMIGWFGDGVPYVGNLDLKPEVANTASFTAAWHDSAREDWQIKVTPYYSYVDDYIGVKPFALNSGGPYSKLRFVNQNAELYGVDVSASKKLWESEDYGRFTLTGMLNYTYGQDADTGSPLYHIMPLNARLGLEHKLGHWTNAVELDLVAEKDRVDPVRLEPQTAAYTLVNLRSSYEWEHIRLDLGVTNLFDQYYQLPLGGVDIGYFPLPTPLHDAVAGTGRSFYAGMTVKF